MVPRCVNCGNDKLRKGECCRREIVRLRSHISNQSRAIERAEDKAERYSRRASKLETARIVELRDPWEDYPDCSYIAEGA
jgi:hypothetical protein